MRTAQPGLDKEGVDGALTGKAATLYQVQDSHRRADRKTNHLHGNQQQQEELGSRNNTSRINKYAQLNIFAKMFLDNYQLINPRAGIC